jgi:UDP-N-acetylglucosamine/UDP-N-acetylgalactosamine diphosphorylase
MAAPSSLSSHTLIAAFTAAGQGQVFACWEHLVPDARARLLAQAAEIDLAVIARLNRTLLGVDAAGPITIPTTSEARPQGPARHDSPPAADLAGLAPAPFEPRPENGGDSAAWAAARATGEAALRAGRVAAFTVAGGQGTRLGYDGPKGTFAVTPVRGKSLFQVFAEKILAAGRRFGKTPRWFVMTSHANHEATESFFVAHHHFGLDPARVHFFRQGRMPAVGFDGQILLEAPDAIALSPDGHGGSLRALDRSGALDLMARDGADVISYFQVDNPLVRCLDAEFIGWHLLRGSEMSSKMVEKSGPGEKVGHFCTLGRQTVVIEYSEPAMQAKAAEREPDGALRYRAGSIALHVLDREFVRRMAAPASAKATARQDGLPFHRADKKIPCLDAAGNLVKPDKPNGVKFEQFVFDALPFAKNPVVIETRRADDFSPVKNVDGADSPATCRADQLRQFARWLRAAGVEIATDATGLPPFAIEVSPLFATDEETFAESWKRLINKPTIQSNLYLE